MRRIIPYLQEHIERHPGMQPRDILKLCYQGAYGGDHLLTDLAKAEGYFNQEFGGVMPREEPLYELISPEMARINLRAWKQAGLPGEWLFRLFTCSARMPTGGNLLAYLDEAETLNFPGFHQARVQYEREGCPSVHHSDVYRKQERPAYRVVNRQLLRLIPVLVRAALIQGEPPHVLAIDGRAASGKTTMAEQLAYILNGAVIHMDHFFLPPELRTRARLDAPGGNVHYERFKEEVLVCLGKAEPFSYRLFDCSQMDYGEPVTVPAKPWRIVEGSYSLHPELGVYYDVSVFSSVAPEEQLKRIAARNGSEILKIFEEKWIPMEEKYFETFDVVEKAMVRC
mgnify:CR=1 FL=1